jgi:hypothetical protein
MSPAAQRSIPGGGHGKLVAIADDIHAALHGRSMSLAAIYDWLERRHSPDQLRSALARLQSDGRVQAEKNSANLPIYSRPDAPPQAAGIKQPPATAQTDAPANAPPDAPPQPAGIKHPQLPGAAQTSAHQRAPTNAPAPARLGPNPYRPGTQPHRIWEWLSEHGPHTYLQIASATGIRDTRVSPTLAMMKSHATVARDKQLGNPSSTWRALPHGPVSAGKPGIKPPARQTEAPPAAPAPAHLPGSDLTQQQAELALFADRLRHASRASDMRLLDQLFAARLRHASITIDLPTALHTLDVITQHAPLSIAYTLGQIRQCLSVLQSAQEPPT